jgi:hypothetical protein
LLERKLILKMRLRERERLLIGKMKLFLENNLKEKKE